MQAALGKTLCAAQAAAMHRDDPNSEIDIHTPSLALRGPHPAMPSQQRGVGNRVGRTVTNRTWQAAPCTHSRTAAATILSVEASID